MGANSFLKNKFTIGLILFVILFAATGTYLYLGSRKTNEEVNKAVYEEGRRLYKAGEWIVAEQKFREALNFTSDPVERAGIKGRLAGSLFHQDPSGTGGSEAVLLWKETASDSALPKSVKAKALNDLAFLYDLGATDEFLQTIVFSEEPYASYLKDAGGNINRAIRRLYEEADELVPTAFSKLEIAFTYVLAFTNGTGEPGLTHKEVAQRIQGNINDAKPLMDPNLYSKSTFAHIQLRHAAALSVSETILHNVDYSEIESAYQKALTLAADGTDINSRRIFSRASLSFALNLATRFGDARAAEIKTLILPVLSSDSNYLPNLTRAVLVLPDAAPGKSYFRSLAKVSPEFRTFLIENGWKL